MRFSFVATTLALRAPPPQALFGLFQPQPSPKDEYQPDRTAKLPGLPTSNDKLFAAAAEGVQAALKDGVPAVEIDFPPSGLSATTRNDGSAKAEQKVHQANAVAAAAIKRKLGKGVVLIGCSAAALAELRAANLDAFSLRDGAAAASGADIAICVQPTGDEQWSAAAALAGCRCVVVLNGLLNNGLLPHAYYYKPLTAYSAQVGGVVRRYPGPYAGYAVGDEAKPLDMEIELATQGRRALPDTNDLQLRLQEMYRW